MKTLAIFDMAGTTIDDRDEVYRVLRESTERYGANYTDEQFQHFMGTEKRWAITQLLKVGGVEPEEELVEKAWQWFRDELKRTYELNPPTPLPGIEDAIATLRSNGIKVGLTTGFSREIADVILSSMGWIGNDDGKDVIDFSCTGDEVAMGRPEPLMIQRVMELAGVSDTDVVISAGDTEADVVSAQRANVTSVGVLTGHLTESDFSALDADIIVDSVADLPRHDIFGF